jgi:predicted TIM-barrel fold metal-dependent hydrolase
LDPIIATCDKYKLPVVLHTEGGNPFCTPLHAEELAKRWPNVKFIMSHGGTWWCVREAVMVAERTSNLYFDTAAAESYQFNLWVKAVGAERVLMGSDWPWNILEAVVNTNEIAIPDPKDREWVMGKSALKLFGLSK